jgi:glutamine amidotransferase
MLMGHDPNNMTTAHEVSVRNRLLNVDGFGVAWYTKSFTDFNPGEGWRPALYKNRQPPEHDLNFNSICANTSTRVCMAHIRAATASAVTEVNNQYYSLLFLQPHLSSSLANTAAAPSSSAATPSCTTA